MHFEWDFRKAERNLRKHGVDFADARLVFQDERLVTVADESEGEERFVAFGVDPIGRVLAVAYTWRGVRVRIISARKATAPERRRYEGNL